MHAHPSVKAARSISMPARQHYRSVLPLPFLFLVSNLLLLYTRPTSGMNALVCPEGMQGPLNQPEGADCGGPCGQFGSCAPGLVCRPISDLAKEQVEEEGEEGMEKGVGSPMLSSKLADLVHHSLGRAPRGVCVPEDSMKASDETFGNDIMRRSGARKAAEATRELGERVAIMGEDDLLRPEGSLHASQQPQQLPEGRNALPAAAEASGGKVPRQGNCPGCPQNVDVSDPEVVAAAKAGVKLMKARGDLGSAEESNNLNLGAILSATSQVVSGIRYKIVLSIVRGGGGGGGGEGLWEVDVVSQPWMASKYSLVGAKRVPKMDGGN